MSLKFDNASQRESYSADTKRAWLSNIVDGEVLEIGCGTGKLIPIISELSPRSRIYAIEKDKSKFIEAYKANPCCRIYNANFLDMNLLPAWKEKFDSIVLSSSLHEILQEAGQASIHSVLSLCHSMLKERLKNMPLSA